MPEIEVTLQQMVQMALGVPTIKKMNLKILHALFEILMEKLSCKNQVVKLGGPDGAALTAALSISTASLLPFDTQNVVRYSDMFAMLDPLETRLGALNVKFEQHLEIIRKKGKINDEIYSYENWERFQMSCEDMCRFPNPQFAKGCKLLTNFEFMNKLQENVSPIHKRMDKLSEDLTKNQVTLLDFKRRCDEKFEKIRLAEGGLMFVENLHLQVNQTAKIFEETMIELDEMFHTKINKLYAPYFKRLILAELVKVERFYLRYKKPKYCPKIKGLNDYEGGKCLSCYQDLVCQQLPIKIDDKQKCVPEKGKGGEKPDGKCFPEPDKEVKPCRGPPGNFSVFRGTNNEYYRAD